jgi:hypothetical protein
MRTIEVTSGKSHDLDPCVGRDLHIDRRTDQHTVSSPRLKAYVSWQGQTKGSRQFDRRTWYLRASPEGAATTAPSTKNGQHAVRSPRLEPYVAWQGQTKRSRQFDPGGHSSQLCPSSFYRRETSLPQARSARYRRARLKRVAFLRAVRSSIVYVAVGRRCAGRILSTSFARRSTPVSSKR